MVHFITLSYQRVDSQHLTDAGFERVKPMAAWERWSQMQDDFSAGLDTISSRHSTVLQQQPLFQNVASTTFPAKCLLEANMHSRNRYSAVARADLESTKAAVSQESKGVTRLVLKDRQMHAKRTTLFS